jgi:putative spermidine/putrescine transport system substrate-binding protein
MSNDVSRRAFLAGAGLALSGVSTTGAALAAESAADVLKGSGNVIVSTWGGGYTAAQRKAFFDGFTAATGIKVTTTGIPDLAKLRLMEKAGNVEWDVVDTEGPMMFKAIDEKLIQPVDYGLISQVVPKSDLLPQTVNEYGVGSVAYGWVIGWSTKTFPNGGPKTWAEFFDKDKFKGRRTLYAEPKPTLEIALMADGVPIDKLYPLDVDRAFASLAKIKPLVDVWAADTSQFDVLMQNAEIDLGCMSPGRIYNQKKAGVPFDFHFNQGLWEQSYWTVPKDAPNAKNAMKLLAWMMQPGPSKAFVEAFPYGVPNKTIDSQLSPEILANMPTAPANLPLEVQVDAAWWTANQDKVTPRWLAFYTAH